MKKSVTILVPAYNEEKNLKDTVNNINSALKNFISDYEILVFDDYSKDKTGEIADELAKKDSRIKVIHNPKNMGLGYNYRRAIQLASKEFFMMVVGDNDLSPKEIRFVLSHIGRADVVIPYHMNDKTARTFLRLVISKTFIHLMNTLMGLNLRAYTTMILHKTKLLKQINITTDSFAYQPEILAKLLKSGSNFMEIGINYADDEESGDTKFFKIKNFIGIFKTISHLFWLIRISERRIYNKRPIRVK
jgi:glycosyltransferase involved in cell wall biosynthesis